MSTLMARWKGLRALIGDAVEHGATAVERVQLATAHQTFAILERIPVVAAPAALIHKVHDASVAAVYGAIRVVNRGVGATLDAAMDLERPA